MTPEELMLISAVRYALGRQSYIVVETCDYVSDHLESLSKNCIKILIRDISEEIEMYHSLGRTCGMECDEKCWLKLLEVLIIHIKYLPKCPFCGGEATLFVIEPTNSDIITTIHKPEYPGSACIECEKCGFILEGRDEKSVIATWYNKEVMDKIKEKQHEEENSSI